MKWRRTIRVIHRDTGYIVALLTIIYAISGIAVNHINDWNPNYIVEKHVVTIKPLSDTLLTKEEAVNYVLSQLQIVDSVKNSFRPTPEIVDIFFEGKTISANIKVGEAAIEVINDRYVFKESNFLHLNTPKKLWTWIADLFAVALVLLAITGIFMNKGKHGLKGRGKWFVALGIVIPIIFLFLYY
ncbi:MAG: PepSY-associated TM helix domain-containing protein [Bacteroidota bacterium]